MVELEELFTFNCNNNTLPGFAGLLGQGVQAVTEEITAVFPTRKVVPAAVAAVVISAAVAAVQVLAAAVVVDPAAAAAVDHLTLVGLPTA
ncbi:MAG: hypothetical protein IPI53_17210 [Saprospiraceae bacterium]|nr:hypothetical protein [Saprospiraceae bacterium]